MNVKRIFWRFHYGNRDWNRDRIGFESLKDQTGNDWIYLGVTLFGHSLIYSEIW